MQSKPKVYISLIAALISLIPLFLGCQSCEKIVNVDLNEAAPRIVIEGLITDRRGPYTVTISKSGSYFNQPVLETVSGAVAVISDNFDNVDTLHEVAPGIYQTTRIRGIQERVYTLKVIAEGEEYTGATTLMDRVNIDSLELRKSDSRFRLDKDPNDNLNLEIHCYFKDPGDKNYYRLKIYRNDTINTENYRLFDDQYTNGEITELRAAYAIRNDTFRIDLLSLDKPTYTYYRTLADMIYTNPFFGSTPANPETNLSNGALGYFGSYSVSSKTLIVTDDLITRVP